MPFIYEIDMSAGVLCKRGVGEVTAGDFRNQIIEEIGHPDFHPGLDSIVDFSRLQPCLSVSEIEGLARTLRRLSPVIGDSRWAVVTDLDVVYDLMWRFISFLGETRIQIKIFQDMGEAKSWLGLAEDYPCPLAARDIA